ncbi:MULTISPECIES: ABC transporter substrate-binding protein [Paenibacillus]|uniref:Putative ABC transporter-binding protein n=1 Tax=Paenibacillus naphthalenovorans TaxID=162209 RepID=A0A0U2VVX8_9BACL|nr:MULTISPECIES: ABC transporter substrate-binding protein [Paenibacillus]ALS23639.1 putative ABC transporter-binding protein [Paenibacillus naphthalenovorans]
MKLWKKSLVFGLVMTSMITLSACGGAQDNGSSSNPSGSDNQSSAANEGNKAEKVKIVFAQGNDQTPATKKLIDAFHAKHPNIEVELRDFPNNSTQMHDQYVTILGGQSSEIDVMNLDVVWPAEFAQAGFLLPLDRFIQEDKIDLSNYLQGGIDAGYFAGQQWALPRYNNAGLLYYRKDLVKSPPKTWDELIQQANELKGQGGTKYGYVYQAKQYEGLVVNFTELAAAYGGQVYDDKGNVSINSANTIKGLNKLIEISKSGFVPTDIKTFTELETRNAFIEGAAVFARHWPALYAQAIDPKVSKIADKVGIAPLPAGDVKSAAALGGWFAAINKYSKHPREAWEFLKFMVGPEGQKIIAIDSTQTPTYLPLFDDPDVQKASPLFANREFVEGLSAAVPRPITPLYAKISDIIQVEVSKAIAGEQTAEQAVQNMEQKIKAAK